MKTFLRWLYTVLLYFLVTALLIFGLASFIRESTLAPRVLNNYEVTFGFVLGHGLTAWIGIIGITIVLMALVSMLMYALWNLVMCSALLGKYPMCENAPIFNWLFIFLHVLVLGGLGWFMTGDFIPDFVNMLSFAQIVIYIFPVVVFTVLFGFVSRVFSPKTCYRFKNLWAVRKGLSLM